MARASFGGSADYSSLFASLYKTTAVEQENDARDAINAEIQRLQSEYAAGRLNEDQYAAALEGVASRLHGLDEAAYWNLMESVNKIRKGALEQAVALQDQKMSTDWEAGLISDDDWLAYVDSRAAGEQDPAKKAQWEQYSVKYHAAIGDQRAEFAFANGGNINDLIGYYQGKLGGLAQDSEDYRKTSLRLYELQDKRASDSLTDGAQKIMDAIETGKATYKELLDFYKGKLFSVRPGSDLEKQLKEQIGKVEDQVKAVDAEARMSKLDYDWQRGAITGSQYAAALRKEAKQYEKSDPKTYYSLLKSALELDKYGGHTSSWKPGSGGGGGGGSSKKALAATVDQLQANRNYWEGIAKEIDKGGATVLDPSTGKYVPVSADLRKQVSTELAKTYDALAAAHTAKGDHSAAQSDRNDKAKFLADTVAPWNSMKVEDSRQHMMTTVNKIVEDALNEPDPATAAWKLGKAADAYERWAQRVYTITEGPTKYVPGPDGTRREVLDTAKQTVTPKTGLQGFDPAKQQEDADNIAMIRLAQQSYVPGAEGQAARDQIANMMGATAERMTNSGPGSIAANATAAAMRLQGEAEGKVSMYLGVDGKWTNATGKPVTKYVLDEAGNQVPSITYQIEPKLDKGQQLVDVVVDVNGHARVVKAVATATSTGFEGNFAAKGFTIKTGRDSTLKIAAGARLSQSDLALLQREFPDSWQQYVERGPAFSYLQVQLPTGNGVRLFSQDPDTKIWVEGPTLPYWHLATNPDGTVQFDNNGNLVGDSLPFIDHFGMAAPTTAGDPREVQDILDSGLLDESYKQIQGRDKNGNLTVSTADKGTMYYDPRDNEAARALAKTSGLKDADEGSDPEYWFDGKTRRPRREKALATQVAEDRKRTEALTKLVGGIQNQPYGKGGTGSQPYSAGTFGGATNTKAAAALVNASAFDTIAEQIGINLAGTQASKPSTFTQIQYPTFATVPSMPTYSGPTTTSFGGWKLPPVPAPTSTITTPKVTVTGFNVAPAYTAPKITTPTIRTPVVNAATGFTTGTKPITTPTTVAKNRPVAS